MSALRRARMLAPLRHRRYRLLATGSLISLVGDGVFFVALPLLVYGIANVPTALAVVGVVWTTSQVSLLLVGGWASDRFERRHILIGADLARALAVGGMGLLAMFGGVQLWHVCVLGAAVGASNAFFNPALSAVVPDLLPDEDLTGANALMGVAKPLLQRTLGPALGGLAVGLSGTPGALLFNAGTFLASAGFLVRMGPAPVPAEAAAHGVDGGAHAPSAAAYARQRLRLTEGLRYVLANRWAWAWMVAAALALTAFTGPVDMLLPFVLLNDMGLDQRQAAFALSMVLATGGVGSMAAAVAVGQLGLPRRFLTAMYLVQAAGVATLAVYGLMTSVWQAVVASFVIGACFAYADVVWVTVLQRHVPRRLLGRVSGVDWLTALGLMPLSFAVAGPLAVTFGARQVLVFGAAFGAVAIAGLLLLVPGSRSLEDSGADCRASLPAPSPRGEAHSAAPMAQASDTTSDSVG